MADIKFTDLIETNTLINDDVFAVAAGTPIKNSRKVTLSSVYRALTGFNGVIDVNNSNPALRVLQRGSGDAFVVQDEANDTTPFVIDGNGNTIIGGTSSDPNNKLTVVGDISATGRTVLRNDLLIQNNFNQFANRNFIFGLDAIYPNGSTTINDGALLRFEYFSDSNSRFLISTIDNQNEPVIIAQSGSTDVFGSRLNRIVVGRDGNVGIGTDSLTAIETFPARLTVYGDVSSTGFFVGNVIAETFATAQPSLIVYDTALARVDGQSIILPISGNDIEITSYNNDSLVTGNVVSLTSFLGGTKGTFYNITNKIPGLNIAISNVGGSVKIRGVGTLTLDPNDTACLRVDSSTRVSVW